MRRPVIPTIALALGALAALPAACRPAPGPPEGGGMLVVSDRGGAMRIYELAPDGGTARLVGSPEAGDRSHTDSMPARLPDGRVVFVSDRDGSPSLYLTSGSEEVVRLLPEPAVGFADVEPSPLGREAILFTRRPPGGPGDLYSVRLDGSGLRQLTRHPADDRSPAAAPDGRSIAFVSDRGGAPRIHLITDPAGADPDAGIVDLTGGKLEARLPPGVRLRDDGPVFLSDGSIAFSRGFEGGGSQIFVMGAAGAAAGLRQVTDSLTLPFGAAEPVALPDGSILLTAGPAPPPENDAAGEPRFAVYRIAAGGFNLERISRDNIAYDDYSRHLSAGR